MIFTTVNTLKCTDDEDSAKQSC